MCWKGSGFRILHTTLTTSLSLGCSLLLLACFLSFSSYKNHPDMDGERRQSYCPAATSAAGSVKIAGLWKRSQGLHRFTRPNFRHRVFILTDQALSYYSGTLDVSWERERVSTHVWFNILLRVQNGTMLQKNWSKFSLTLLSLFLSFSLQKIGHLKGRIPIESVKAVEFVEQGALGLAHTLQVSDGSREGVGEPI